MAIPQSQRPTAALLQALAGRPPLETHISAIFVGADTAWKLRKAVRLPFLDFTDPAERRRTARRELELNAVHAPGMYRDVVPVTRTPGGGAELDGPGEPIDWVLRMAPLRPENFLDAVAESGGLSPALLDAIGDSVAALHAALAPVDRDQHAALRDVAAGNLRSALSAGLDPAAARRWHDGELALLDARAAWLAARRRDGFVRRIHGDLHLGNMALWHGRPVPFDALEFSEDLATFDTGYDLAFLLMDLDRRAGRPAANRVMNRVLARSGDVGVTAGLPAFLSMRALIRAHVEASRSHPADAADYLGRALAYQSPPAPLVVAIGGLPATGKSTLARAIAAELGAAPGAVVLRSDEIRKRQHGVAPETRLPQSAYTPAASDAVFAEIMRNVAILAGAGHAAIADATFLDPGHRDAVHRAAGPARFLGLWLQAPLAVLEARIRSRIGDASDAGPGVLRRLAGADPGPRGWLAVDAADGAAALAAVRRAIRSGTVTAA